MSLLKKLFGLGGSVGGERVAPQADGGSAPEEYKGFVIRATPFEEGGMFQLSGVISKEGDGVTREHAFIRADRLPSREIAASMAHSKARQMIDFEGEALFNRTG